MRLGVSLTSRHPTDDHAQGAKWIIERARVARDAGLDSLSLGDHHSTPVPYYQGVPMLARLIAEWDPQRPIGCLFLLPLWNPVLVAEQVGTLAALHPAPFLLQTGAGDGVEQFAAMGGNLRTRGDDIDESLRIIKALLAGDTVDSERFGITGAQVNPRPPHGIEWWIGAGSGRALRRAAREGDAWYGGPHVSASNTAMVETYREQAERLGRPHRVIVRKDVIILRDGNRANELGEELLRRGYRGMTREVVVIGGVRQAIDQLAPLAEIGVDEVVIRCMAASQADALETLELAGEVRASLIG